MVFDLRGTHSGLFDKDNITLNLYYGRVELSIGVQCLRLSANPEAQNL